MKERPILFSAPMVRALLDGSKTQTRRVVKWHGLQQGLNLGFSGLSVERSGSNFVLSSPTRTSHEYRSIPQPCPYGQPGDRLWVRETTHRRPMLNILTGEPLALEFDGGAYTADHKEILTLEGFDIAWWYSRKTCPAIHMPRWASRITLEVVSVRVERLQDISEDDAMAEGIHKYPHQWRDCEYPLPDIAYEAAPGSAMRHSSSVAAYRDLWEQINGLGSWEANPWVWVVEFKPLANTNDQP